MIDRRYNDEEIAAIFARAAQGSTTPPVDTQQQDGLTLSELQEIGREVGLEPASVAAAARALVPPAPREGSTLLGLPISVGRTVTLDRRMTEDEWEQLGVELREVFNARGTMSASGGFRQWTNGNLQVLLEPTATGHRLRLRTSNGRSRALLRAGLAALGVTGILAVSSAAGGQFSGALPGVAGAFATSAILLANGAFSLPGWARRRREQMDAIAARLAQRM